MRRILNQFKQWFKKTFLTKEVVVVNKEIIEFRQRGIDMTKLLLTDQSAQMWYDYIVNKYIDAVTSFNKEEAAIYHDLLITIKQIAEKNWHKIRLG